MHEGEAPDNSNPHASDLRSHHHMNIGLLTVVLAAAYIFAGYIGFTLALPPGNVSILWPPSGIAMAAIFIWGNRSIPGILIGAAFINGQAIFDGSATTIEIAPIAAAIGISIGSVLQPIVGRYLIQRFGNFDNPFEDGLSILKSIIIFAVICSISAVIGILSLYVAGIVEGDIIELFVTWWVGDFFGVISFMPVVLSMVRQSKYVAAALVAATCLSFGGVYLISDHIRSQVAVTWGNQASREAERLTTSLFSLLEAASSPVNAMTALLKASEEVNKNEFLDAAIQLEDYQPDVFPRTMGVAAAIDGVTAVDWEIVFSTDHDGPLSVSKVISDGDLAFDAINAARDEPERMIIGEFGTLDGDSVAISAVAIRAGGEEKVVFGVLNLTQMFDGLLDLQAPPGFHLHLSGTPSGRNPENLVPIYGHGHEVEQIITSKHIRGTVGNASFTLRWDVTDQFLPGSRSTLANALLVGGIFGAAALLLFFTFILGQNEKIRQRVKERTVELSRQKSILESTMEAIDQGITMFDRDFNLLARNAEFNNMFDIPKEKFPFGSNFADMLRFNAERGDYGDGDVEQMVQDRLALAAKFEPHRFERTLQNGNVYEVRGNPLPGNAGFVTTYTDISERKKAEQEIAEKEALLRMALENMPGGIAMIDADMKIQVFNDTYRELYGHAAGSYGVGTHIGDVIRMNVESGIHKTGDHVSGDVDESVRRRLDVFRSGEAGESEREMKDGRTLNIRHNPLKNGGVVLVATDITARRKAETAIARQEAQIRAILESVPDAVVTINTEGTIQSVNKAAEEVFGYAPEELLGQDIKVLMPEQYSKHHDGYMDTYMQTGEARFIGQGPRELSGQRKSGEIFPIDISIAEAVSDSDRVFVGVLRDITARKEGERIIAEKEAQLRLVLDNMPGGMIVVDAEQKVLFVNNMYKEFYGDSDGILQPGASMLEILKSEARRGVLGEGDADKIAEERFSGYRNAQALSILDHVADGRHIQLTRKPIEGGNTISVAIDVTDLKQTERELAQKEAMLTAALENMTGGLFMIDADMHLRVFNERFAEFYEFPKEILKIDTPLAEVLRVRAARGEYGEGDPEELVQMRLDGYRNRDVQIVIDKVGERLIEVYRAPMDDGGMVCVFNDVTERKQAEEALTRAHSLITESLSYASRIQRSLLPPKTILDEVFKSHAMIWEPKDMVGGDMIWLRPGGGGFYLIVADCTGHGPPGAFMTMICTGALDQALAEIEGSNPAAILEQMNIKIKTALGQDGEDGESDDGVELGICHIDDKSKKITFAGARFFLLVVEEGKTQEIKGKKSSIGYRHVSRDITFENHIIDYNSNMQFYMWSDGMVDQVGGPRRRGFGKRRLINIILDYHKMDMPWQRSQILREFNDYQHEESRRDDVTFFGFTPR